MFRLASYEKDPEVRKKLLTFAVVGSGFTGVEMAGELGEAKDHLSVQYNIDKSEVTIYNVEATDRILRTLESEKQIAKVEKRYRKLGITLLKSAAIVKAEEGAFTLKDGTKIECNTLIWGAGIQASKFAQNLGLQTNRGGRLVVNEYMQSPDYKNVFIVGDNTHYEDADGSMPQIVEAAEQSGHTAAVNVAAMIEGKEMHAHKQNYHGFMVSVGSRYCVSDNNGFRLSGWLSMLVKRSRKAFSSPLIFNSYRLNRTSLSSLIWPSAAISPLFRITT
jgi:NADH dehydrogenase